MVFFDELQKLSEMSWKGIPFPTMNVEVTLEQDVAEHLRPGQNGGRLEGTGRRPLIISAEIPFRNALFGGRGETWKERGPLYPTQYIAFMDLASDGTTGDLVHPSLGIIRCKLISARSKLSADKRDGEDVSVTWKSTTQSADDVELLFTTASPGNVAASAARALDTALGQDIVLKNADPDKGVPSFEDCIANATKVVDQVGLVSRTAGGGLTRMLFRAQQLSNSVERLADPQYWGAKQAVQKLIAAGTQLQRELLKVAKPTSIYRNPQPQPLSTLAIYLKNDVGEILSLNPTLTGSQFVPAFVPVRYYVRG